MALRNSTKGSIDLLRTKKQNEIIFNQLQKMRRNPHFLLFCGKFYLEGCVYFRFFCILRKTGSLESSFVWCFFAFLAFFLSNVATLQFIVTCQAFFANFV